MILESTIERCCIMVIFWPWLSLHSLRSFYAILRMYYC